MNRSFTNLIRFILDECIPPIIRDSKWFMFPFYWISYRGKLISTAMNFKKRVTRMSHDEYAHFYESIDTISRHRETDLNAGCIDAILKVIPKGPVKILDAGCGNGFLLRKISEQFPEAILHGIDLKKPAQEFSGRFERGSVERIPFSDKYFDLVFCTHTLEHCLRLEKALNELKRVARSELIVVVPKQRPYFYTLDEHVQFFFYEEQLTVAMGLPQYECHSIGGDWFYRGYIEEMKNVLP